jgi:hypothetical protein
VVSKKVSVIDDLLKTGVLYATRILIGLVMTVPGALRKKAKNTVDGIN